MITMRAQSQTRGYLARKDAKGKDKDREPINGGEQGGDRELEETRRGERKHVESE